MATEKPAELVMLNVRVSPDLRKRLRMAAVTEEREIQEIVTEAVETYLAARSK